MILLNTRSELLFIEQGQKIAQMLIQPVQRFEINEVQEISSTERGQNGFGSTGD